MKNLFFRVLLLLMLAAATSHAQVLMQAEYFVDIDPGVGYATPLELIPGDTVMKDFSFNVGTLSKGYHTLNVRCRDALGRWGGVMSSGIYVYGTEYQPVILPRFFPITKAEFFYDNDPGEGKGMLLPLIRGDSVDAYRYLWVNSLDTGYHYLYIRAMGEDYLWGLTQRIRFHVDSISCVMPLTDFTHDTVTFGTPCHLTSLSTQTLPASVYKWDLNNDGSVDYNTQNVTHSFESPGYYQVKLTTENTSRCKSEMLRDVITGPLPDTSIYIAGFTQLCAGDSVILTSNNYDEGTTFDWSTGDTTRAITVKASGDYFCWVRNSYGIPRRSETVHVTVKEVPLVVLSYHNTSGGYSNGSAWVEVSGGTGQYSYEWSNGSHLPIQNGLGTGYYTVMVTDGNCPVYKEFTLTNYAITPGNIVAAEYYFDADPGAGNGSPITIWAADTIDFMCIASLSGLSTGFHTLFIRTRDTYGQWSFHKGTNFYIRPPDPEIIQPAEQPQITKAEYFINTDPGVGHGVNIPITEGGEISLDFTFPTAGLSTGFYNIFVRACDAANKWSIYNGLTFYVHDTLVADLTKKYKSIAGVEYFYDTDPGIRNSNLMKSNIYDTIVMTRDIRVAGLAPGSHYIYLRAYDEKGFTGIWQRAAFTIRNVSCTCPVVDFSADTVHNLGSPTHFVNISSNIGTDAIYEWDVNGDKLIDYSTADVNHVYSQFGLYNARLTVRNTDSCYASMTRQVVVSPEIDTSLTIQGELTLCEGDSVKLIAEPGYQYNWSSDETTRIITVKHSGDYSVRLTNVYGVQAFSRMIHVTVNDLPVVELITIDASDGNANGTAICNVSGGSGHYSYSWSNGSTLSIVNNLLPGNYTVTVNDGRCPVSRSFSIGTHPTYPGDIVGAEYFFDTEPGIGNGYPMNISGGDSVYYATCLPMGTLPIGFHDLYVRVRDTYGRWSFLQTQKIYVSQPYDLLSEAVQPLLVSAEYFYDADPAPANGFKVTFPADEEVLEDVSVVTTGLQPGFHDLSVRAMDSTGKWSITKGEKMYVYSIAEQLTPAIQSKLIAAEYFYDNDPGVGNGISIPFTPTGDSISMYRYFPTEGLSPGIHYLFIRVQDEAGHWGLGKGIGFIVRYTLCSSPTVSFTTGFATAGSPVQITNTSENLQSGTTYQWDIGNDGIYEYSTKDISHVFSLPGNYDVVLKVINTDSCKASILKQVVVGPFPSGTITVTGNTTFCDGDSVLLSASPGFSYQWWPTGQTSQSIYAKNSGEYYCWLKTAYDVEIKSQAITVTRHQIPSVTLHVVNASGGKSNGSAWVDVTGGSGNYSFLWSSGSTRIYANNLAPGNYSVEVNDGYCPIVQNFTVGTHPVFPGNVIAAEYFFDGDPGIGMGTSLNIAAGDTVEYFTGFEVTGLSLGYHTVFTRVMDTYGQWSMVLQDSFYIHALPGFVPVPEQPAITAGEYFMDLDANLKPDPGVGLGDIISLIPGDTVDGEFDFLVDTMAVGFHHVAARVHDLDWKWSHNYPALFYIYDTTRRDVRTYQPTIIAAEYFVDTDPGVGNGVSLNILPGDTVTLDFSIPLGTMPLGMHNLYIRVKDADDKWSLYKKAGFGVYDCTQPDAKFDFVQTCITSPIIFNDSSTNVNPLATYAWDINNDGLVDYTTHGSVSHKYTLPGVYQCKLKITHNVACVDSITKTVVFPFVHLQNDTTLYTDQSLVLDGGQGYSYLWSTSDTTQTITVNGATVGLGLHSYSVVVTNGLSCTATDAINVTVTLPPRDLIITSALLNPDTVPFLGDSISVISLIKNNGTISATASVVNYYLSQDSVLLPSDQYLGYEIVDILPPGYTQPVSSRILIPPGVIGQKWYILIKADGTDLVVENLENNNLRPVEFYYGQLLHKQLSGKLYLEGLFNTITHTMNKAADENGTHWNGNVSDQVKIVLHSSTFPYATVYEKDGVDVKQDGTFSCTIPAAITGDYYLAVVHRNSIETWSALPLNFESTSIIYDFTTGLNKAYGGNLKEINGYFLIYAGDVNQDGLLDSEDLIPVDNVASEHREGYLPEDVNGDGYINSEDINMIINNAGNFISRAVPY